MGVYREITQLKTQNPEAYLVEMQFLGIKKCQIMIRDWSGRDPAKNPCGYLDPTEDEMESIAKQMKALGAHSF